MRKIDRLRKEALQSCKARGHVMGRFTRYYHRKSDPCPGGYSSCKVCDAWVQICTRPAPNSIDIGGPAVAINCERDKP